MNKHHYVNKDGWGVRVSCSWEEEAPKYIMCTTCMGSGNMIDHSSNELWKFDPPMTTCTRCYGSGEERVPAELPKPPIPQELINRLTKTIKDFGGEYSNNPDWEEPFNNHGDNI